MKEYGGYIALESFGEEYYGRGEGITLRFNAARFAILEAFRDGGSRRIWIPLYTCPSIYEVFNNENIEVRFYNINSDFMPELENIGVDECILVTNYFGIMDDSFYQKILKRYTNIIFDNAQGFFLKPVLQEHVYNIYSPRKFLGVSDGAYLITKCLYKEHRTKKDISSKRAGYLLKAKDFGINATYMEFLSSEEDLAGSGVCEMSSLTRTLLCNIDYNVVKSKRERNFRFFHQKLRDINELKINRLNISPIAYPLLLEKGEEFRSYLIKNKVFVSQWWKWVLSNRIANTWECKLSKYLYPLPINQGYSTLDLQEIVDIILKYDIN